MLFSQVREDPMAEIQYVQKRTNAKCLYVTSGGCSILSLLGSCSDSISRIDCVDINPMQTKLAKLKLALCRFYKDDLEKLLDFYEGRSTDKFIILGQLHEYLTETDFRFWANEISLIESGINQTG